MARFSGYTQGLRFHGTYTFVGLPKIREKSELEDLPILDRVKGLKCGVWKADPRTGEMVGFVEFKAGSEELLAVEVFPGVR